MSSVDLLLRSVDPCRGVECLEFGSVHMPIGELDYRALIGHMLVGRLRVVHSIPFGFRGIALDCGVLRALEVLLMLDLFQFMYKQSDLGFGLLGRQRIAILGNQAFLYIGEC